MQQKTAILVFANSAKEEIKHKPVPGGEALFTGLNEHTLRQVKQTNLPYFHITEKEQEGTNFGERFLNAIKQVMANGYQQLITIGNDTPQLTTSLILKAQSSLNTKEMVLGPSHDGGFYLMGFNTALINSLDPHQFKKLPWQTAQLATCFYQLLELNKQQTTVLPTLLDLDRLRDFQIITQQPTNLPPRLKSILQSIFGLKQQLNYSPPSLPIKYLTDTFYNKGSPKSMHLSAYCKQFSLGT